MKKFKWLVLLVVLTLSISCFAFVACSDDKYSKAAHITESELWEIALEGNVEKIEVDGSASIKAYIYFFDNNNPVYYTIIASRPSFEDRLIEINASLTNPIKLYFNNPTI